MEDRAFVAIGCFVILKFAAYAAGGRVLGSFFRTRSVPPLLFGLTRMFAGLLVGAFVVVAWHPHFSLRDLSWYGTLALIRFFVWAACVTIFFGWKSLWKTLVASLGGTLLSYLSDIPIAFVALPLVLRTSC